MTATAAGAAFRRTSTFGCGMSRQTSSRATIGGVSHRLTRVPADTAFDTRLVGRWRNPTFGAEITIRADATARMPGAAETKLTPLPGGRALADMAHGPWRHRPCFCLQPDGSLLLASHRARVLHFDRNFPRSVLMKRLAIALIGATLTIAGASAPARVEPRAARRPACRPQDARSRCRLDRHHAHARVDDLRDAVRLGRKPQAQAADGRQASRRRRMASPGRSRSAQVSSSTTASR